MESTEPVSAPTAAAATADTSAPEPTVVLHWLEESRSHRILWLLEELNVPFAIKIYSRDPHTHMAGPELKKVHPRGKFPVIEDNGKVVAESGLIIEYLIAKYGKGTVFDWPKTADQEFDVKYYLHYAEGSFIATLLLLILTAGIRSLGMPFFVRPLVRLITEKIDGAFAKPDAIEQLTFLEDRLKENGTGYFVGSALSGADIILIFPVQLSISLVGMTKEQFPVLYEWMEAMENREAYKRANKRVLETGFKGKLV
ncbi:uncharacterized protein V1518DRAFT_431767 [Limtongia smithiae]|uniref:uncharacterized protein n=1 Tax=Limtongia smithiae TaxID=1125753 RepID=UPI0034CDAE98